MIKLIIAAAFLTAACTVDVSPGPGGTGTGAAGNGTGSNGTGNDGTTTTVNGKPANEFYGQLTNEKTEGYMSGAGSFAAVESGDNAFKIDLFLLQEGDFVLFYTEGTGEVTGTGHSLATRKDRNRRVTGQWTIEGSSLRVGDALRCAGMDLNDSPALMCELTKAIGYDAAVGKSATLRIARSSGKVTPDDARWAEYR